MSDELDTAKRYRQRAEELRVVAAEETSREQRFALERIARDYEAMAHTMEMIDRTNRAHGPRNTD
jgi:hypothetical protein